MKIITTVLMAIGGIGILLLIGVVLCFFLYLLTPSIKGQMEVMPVTLDSVQSYDQKIDTFKEEIEAASIAKQVKELTLTITEEEINSKAIEMLAEGKLPFKEILINFNDDVCWVYATSDNPGIDAKIGIIAQMDVVDSDIKVIVIDFQVGKLPLPKSLDTGMSRLLDAMVKLQGPTEDLPIELTAIDIDDGQFVVNGVTKVVE